MSKRQREDSVSTTAPSISGVSPQQPTSTKAAKLERRVQQSKVILCSLPPHKPVGFQTVEDYEIHYQKVHLHSCSECGRNFPTAHMLSLHITENHDPIWTARKARGEKMYGCLVENCEKVCATWQKRKMHVLAKHAFPVDYDFLIVDKGLGNRRSMLRKDYDKYHPKRSSDSASQTSSTIATGEESSTAGRSRQNGDESSVDEEESSDEDDEATDDSSDNVDTEDNAEQEQRRPKQVAADKIAKDERSKASAKQADLDDLTESMSALKFVPRSIQFGRGGRRGLAKR